MDSSRSALPQPAGPVMERLPCLATCTPAPATTKAATVEMLNVPAPSPPVPQVSTSGLPRKAGVHRGGHPPHGAGEPDQFLRGFALHAQRHQKAGDARGAHLAVEDGQHGGLGFGGVRSSAAGDLFQIV